MNKAVAGCGFAAVAAGWVGHGMWHALPWERFALSLLLAAASMLVAWPLARLGRISMALALLLVWIGAAAFFIGIVPLLTIALLAMAAWGLGLRLLPVRAVAAEPFVAMALGLTVLGGLAGWTLAWPIHTLWLWVAVLVAIVLLRLGPIRTAASVAAGAWREAVAGSPPWSAFAVLLLGLASTACWFPTLQADDLAYHLALPSQLLAYGQYQPDARHQIWAFAPWLGDSLQGIGFVVAKQDSRGALNLLWLAIAAGAAGSLGAALRATPRQRWMCIALFASFPPLVWLAAGMQTELPAIALLFALASVLQSRQARWWVVAVLFGGLLALKLIHAFAAAPLLAYALWQGRARFSWRRALLAVGVVIGVSGSSYAFAWLHTGNPFFPLFNTVFASPDYPLRDFDDLRWHAGFTAQLPWRLVFDTSRYFEAWDGAIGFALIALAGGTMLALRRRNTRWFAVAACGALALSLLPMQYARYAFPTMALLTLISLPALIDTLGNRSASLLVAALCVLNLAYQANASWLHHSSALKRLIRSGGDASPVFAHYAPERELLRRIPGCSASRVLATDPQRNVVAELAGRGRTVSGHDPTLASMRVAADSDRSGRTWLALVAASGAEWLLVTPASAGAGLRAALTVSGARRIEHVGDAELWRIPPREPRAP